MSESRSSKKHHKRKRSKATTKHPDLEGETLSVGSSGKKEKFAESKSNGEAKSKNGSNHDSRDLGSSMSENITTSQDRSSKKSDKASKKSSKQNSSKSSQNLDKKAEKEESRKAKKKQSQMTLVTSGDTTIRFEGATKGDAKVLRVPQVEGFLYKYTNLAKGWRKRYFILESGILIYYRKKKMSNPRDTINLARAVIVLSKSSKCEFTINTDNAVFHLRAKTRAIKDKWVDAMTRSKSVISDLTSNDRMSSLRSPITEGDALASLNEKIAESKDLEKSLAKLLKDLNKQTNEEGSSKKKGDKKKKNNGDITTVDGHKFVEKAEEYLGAARGLLSAADDASAILQNHTQVLRQVDRLQVEKAILIAKLRKIKKSDYYGREKSKGRNTIDPDSNSDDMFKMDEEEEEDDEEDESMSDPIQQYGSPLDGSDSDEFFDAEEPSMSFYDAVDDSVLLYRRGSQGSFAREVLPKEDLRRQGGPTIVRSVSESNSLVERAHSRRMSESRQRNKAMNSPARHRSVSDGTGDDIESVHHESMKTFEDTMKEAGQIKRRTQLPYVGKIQNKPSLLKILKDAIGKDLSRITIPVHFSEPLSMLQRLTEDVEYSDLLDKAAAEDDPAKRLLWLATYAISPHAATLDRTNKPFNPLLGETYENVREDKGYRLLTEQVSHHPPESAFYCESKDWYIYGNAWVKNKFWGKSLELLPIGEIHIKIPKYDDHVTFSKVTCCIHNVLIGTKYIAHYGRMNIKNHTTGHYCKLEFAKPSLWGGTQHAVKGSVYDKDDNMLYVIEGKFSDKVSAKEVLPDGTETEPKTLWEVRPRPSNAKKQYNFTSFSIELNELTPGLEDKLPATDTRLRPDQRAMENGDITVASKEKERLENLQRARRKLREANKEEWEPRWFVPSENGQSWEYRGGYWESRASGKWEGVMETIFVDKDQED
eukprot:CAMPEP_0168532826 /NCGR_PEP_ID=MMETSP0405-20121227/16592_1 /TAXON_ID=498012 /ORGANISM="Trichosphaerium sp, Strain Am-I-7 wt" /LENGTH=933 /DNA_ID=CAMNT_0008558529 /DNA_START=42 /DNA_END=2843 /DNA_ORIENTATION=-